MVELTPFLQNIGKLKGFGGNIDIGTSTSRGGQSFGESEFIQSGQSTRDIIEQTQQIQRRNLLGSVNVQELIHENLIGLGKASVDISEAVGEQIRIREQQKQAAESSRQQLREDFEETKGILSEQVVNLGKIPAAGSGFDPIGFFTNNPLLLGLSAGGLAVGGIALLLLIKS